MTDLADLIERSNTIENTSIRVDHFKSYGDGKLLISSLRKVNLIVGRNNSGKSSILDAIEVLCGVREPEVSHFHNQIPSKFIMRGQIGSVLAQNFFRKDTSEGYIQGNHWDRVGKYVQHCDVEVSLGAKGKPAFHAFHPTRELQSIEVYDSNGRSTPLESLKEFKSRIEDLSLQFDNPYKHYAVFRISAERDVTPEGRSGSLGLSSTGRGLTNMVGQILTSTKYDTAIIEEQFKSRINSILSPDVQINNIRAREHDSGQWELFFEEPEKGLVSLSNSGSGIKTVMMVVAATYLLPALGILKNKRTIFMIEEPENNLHPALQRRLSEYLVRVVSGADFKIVATSHSSAMMDSFSSYQDSQIIHVTSKSEGVETVGVQNVFGKRGVLDDIDARASDLLLSNGVVWVEGPSDRSYIRAMVNILSNGMLIEGVHYQCVFYGGRLLNHLGADIESDGRSQEMSVFRISRNAAIIIDSDMSDVSGQINQTKSRIVAEVEASGGFSWVTHGREFENYLPKSVLSKVDARLSRSIDRFEEIESYLEEFLGEADARRLIRSKSSFADLVCEKLDSVDIKESPELEKRVLALVHEIACWNGLSLVAS